MSSFWWEVGGVSQARHNVIGMWEPAGGHGCSQDKQLTQTKQQGTVACYVQVGSRDMGVMYCWWPKSRHAFWFSAAAQFKKKIVLCTGPLASLCAINYMLATLVVLFFLCRNSSRRNQPIACAVFVLANMTTKENHNISPMLTQQLHVWPMTVLWAIIKGGLPKLTLSYFTPYQFIPHSLCFNMISI